MARLDTWLLRPAAQCHVFVEVLSSGVPSGYILGGPEMPLPGAVEIGQSNMENLKRYKFIEHDVH